MNINTGENHFTLRIILVSFYSGVHRKPLLAKDIISFKWAF